MEFKWLKTAYQFEAEPGGGGGETASPPASTTDPSPEAVSAPSAAGVTPGESPTPPPPPEPAAEPEPIPVPESTRAIFQPPPAETYYPPQTGGAPQGPPPADPEAPAPPPKVDPPTQDEWDIDPAKAGVKMQAYYDYQIYEKTAPLQQTIREQDTRDRHAQDAEFARKSAEVQHSAKMCSTAVDGFYAKDSILNRDSEFRASPEIRKHVEDTINACVARAMDVADRTGDSARLNDISNNPKFLKRVLRMAKGEVEDAATAIRPGASPQGPQAVSGVKGDGLTVEDRDALAAAKADGVTYTPEQIRKAKAMRGE